MSASPGVRRFYRVVRTNPPTVRDFLSLKTLGRRLRPDAGDVQRRIYDGLSVSSTIEGAHSTAARYPRTGMFIAVRDVPDDGRFRIAQTTATATHYTIWGDATALLGYVTAILPQGDER